MWSPSSDNLPTTDSWTGYRSLLIKSQKISVDSSAFHQITGISYLQNQDALLITLFDGSFHVICDLSRDPRWASTSVVQNDNSEIDYQSLTSENLSKMSRSIFVKVEKGNVDRRDMVKINGVTSYDDASCFSWVYECVYHPFNCSFLTKEIFINVFLCRSSRPSDFSYKHDAKHSNTLIVAQMWEEQNDEIFFQKLSTLLDTVKACMTIVIHNIYLVITI